MAFLTQILNLQQNITNVYKNATMLPFNNSKTDPFKTVVINLIYVLMHNLDRRVLVNHIRLILP